jgi:hypothetical protein
MTGHGPRAMRFEDYGHVLSDVPYLVPELHYLPCVLNVLLRLPDAVRFYQPQPQ